MPFAWWLSAGAHQMTPRWHGGGSDHLHAELNNRARETRGMWDQSRDPSKPVSRCMEEKKSSLLCFEVKCNYPLLGMVASSDPEVEGSQLDVDHKHQPQGGLCRLLCATEYSCPHQYPRVVSVYPAMLLAVRVRKTEWMPLMLKCLHWNLYI